MAGEVALGVLAVGDVADRSGGEQAVLGLDARQADLGGELAAVAAQPVEVKACAHRARARIVEVAAAMAGVGGVVALGDELLDALADELVAGVAEELLGLGVDEDDASAAADADDRVRRGLQ